MQERSSEVATDTIARALAQGMSRREALRKGGAAFLAAMALSPSDAWARLRGHCPKHHVKCGKKCCPKGEICIHPKHKHKKHAKPRCGCPPHTKRRHGKCVPSGCTNGQSTCSGKCVSLTHDPKNCGTCGHVCAAGLVCANSKCVGSCPPPTTNCSGGCVNLNTDPFNCSKCGSPCPTGKECSAGVCVNPCPSGTTTCNGGCVDIRNDPQNCGKCGSVCGAGTVCANGHCATSCPSGQTLCNGVCVDTATNAKNCGTCGHACGTGHVCQSSTCAAGCSGGTVNCSGSCCPGTGCCGVDCQTVHGNGAGQNYYDCNALGTPGNPATYSYALAVEAWRAFTGSTGSPPTPRSCAGAPSTCTGSCLSISGSNGTQTATWVYTGSLAGYVKVAGAPECPQSTADTTWT